MVFYVKTLTIPGENVVTGVSSERKLSRKNAKIFVRISQTFSKISHFFAKIKKATYIMRKLCKISENTFRKNCFCEILRKMILRKKYFTKIIVVENIFFAKFSRNNLSFSLETQVVILTEVFLENNFLLFGLVLSVLIQIFKLFL